MLFNALICAFTPNWRKYSILQLSNNNNTTPTRDISSFKIEMLLISLLVVALICLVSQLLIDGIPYTNDKEERVHRVLLINNTMTATTSHEKQYKHIAELMSNRDTPLNVLKNLSSHHSDESGIGMNSKNLPLASGVSRVDVGINMMRKLYYTRSNNKSTTAQTGNLQNVKVPIQFPTIFNSSVLTESFECIQKRYFHVRPALASLIIEVIIKLSVYQKHFRSSEFWNSMLTMPQSAFLAQDKEDKWLFHNLFFGRTNGVIVESGALNGLSLLRKY